jgi:hypothetical protein
MTQGGGRVVEGEDSRREQTEDLRAWMGDPVEVVFDDPHARSIQGVLRGHNHTGVFLVYVDEGDEPQTIFCPWTAVRLLRRG